MDSMTFRSDLDLTVARLRADARQAGAKILYFDKVQDQV
jgi:hypothetical protein